MTPVERTFVVTDAPTSGRAGRWTQAREYLLEPLQQWRGYSVVPTSIRYMDRQTETGAWQSAADQAVAACRNRDSLRFFTSPRGLRLWAERLTVEDRGNLRIIRSGPAGALAGARWQEAFSRGEKAYLARRFGISPVLGMRGDFHVLRSRAVGEGYCLAFVSRFAHLSASRLFACPTGHHPIDRFERDVAILEEHLGTTFARPSDPVLPPVRPRASMPLPPPPPLPTWIPPGP